jgi:hypothetical protein
LPEVRGRFKYFLLLSFAVCYSFQCQNNNNTSAAPVAKSAFVGHSDSLKVVYSNLFYKLDTFFKNKYRLGGFNGAVIVAKGDRIYYQTALGYENYQTKDTLTTTSSFQIASVSKTFTATANFLFSRTWQIENLTIPSAHLFPISHTETFGLKICFRIAADCRITCILVKCYGKIKVFT